ncbi:MAG: DNA gyrase inhibitor YacG [Verrucomicrobiia bacterium]|jgi:endogenous inhibitor of DNA gyrase (YacG/DUF329 family)
MSEDRNNPELNCPQCKQRGRWFAAEWGPFCSERCKMVDLGKWLDEDHKIAEPLRPDIFQDYEDLPPGAYLDQPEPID